MALQFLYTFLILIAASILGINLAEPELPKAGNFFAAMLGVGLLGVFISAIAAIWS